MKEEEREGGMGRRRGGVEGSGQRLPQGETNEAVTSQELESNGFWSP